jgi:HK97 family phage portal protein
MAKVANKTSWLAKLFKPHPRRVGTDILTMGYEPKFSSFGAQKLYSSLVLCSVHTKQKFFAKLEPRHVRWKDGKKEIVTDSSVAKVLRNPNHYQTTFEFLAQAFFMRERDKTCYILVDREKKNGYWENHNLIVLLPSQPPEVKEDAQGNMYWQMFFDNGIGEVWFHFADIIPWKKDIEDNQYSGGGTYSKNANADLLGTLQAHRTITESVAEASKLGCMFDGLLKVNAYGGDDEDTKRIRDAFMEDIRTSKGKIPVLDNGADYQQVQRQLKMVDDKTLAEIKASILVTEGVSFDFLMGKFTTAEKEAFYEMHIEPAAISLGQAMSKVLLTWGSDAIELYPHKVQLMATSEIVSIIQSTIAAGVFMKDEYREMLGYAPLPNGEGQTMPRGFNSLDGVPDAGGVTQ